MDVVELSGPAAPPSDKSFPAAVHTDGTRLPAGPDLSPHIPVQISEVVTWAAEFRLFLLDGRVRPGSQYAAFGHLDAAPLDRHPRRGAVLYSAVVLDVVLRAAGLRDRLPERDGPFRPRQAAGC